MGARYSVTRQADEGKERRFLEKLEHQLATGGCRECDPILDRYPTPELAVAAAVRDYFEAERPIFDGKDRFRG